MTVLQLRFALVVAIAGTTLGCRASEANPGGSHKTTSETQASAGVRPQQNSPSFDCTKASKPAEHLVCASGELSALDRAVTLNFRRAVKVKPDIRDGQREWLRSVRDACENRNCLLGTYRTRLKVLLSVVKEKANQLDDVSGIDDTGVQTYLITYETCLRDAGYLVAYHRDENSVPKHINDACTAEAQKATEWHPSRPEGVPDGTNS